MKKLAFSTCAILIAVYLLTVGVLPLVADTIDAWVKLSPNNLVLASKSVWLTAHTNIPYGSVDTSTVCLDGLKASVTKSDDRGYLVAKFDVDEVKNMVSPPEATLTLSGALWNGTTFSGSDTIVVIAGGR